MNLSKQNAKDIFATKHPQKIYLKGESLGHSLQGFFFYVDRPAGHYIVSCPINHGPKHDLSFWLISQETIYIRNVPTWSEISQVAPTIEDEAIAMKTLPACRYWP